MNIKTKNKKFNRSERGATVSEFDQRVLDLARVARMAAGGRRFNFRATVIVGDRKGRVGIGVAKGRDVSMAISKAARQAQKNIIHVSITSSGTIPHETVGKQTGSIVFLKPARSGRGIIAGGATRIVCDLAGYKDITAKTLSRSTNKLNNALATINAFKKIKPIVLEKKKKVAKEAKLVVEKDKSRNLLIKAKSKARKLKAIDRTE